MEKFTVEPVGVVRKHDGDVWLEIHAPYRDALLGLEAFSHMTVLFWFHRNDTPEKRRTLQVHPRKDAGNPLTGVFATHSPMRPNLIGMTRCRILGISGGRVDIDDIDALDETPVIDIKCYIPAADPVEEVRVPDWV